MGKDTFKKQFFLLGEAAVLAYDRGNFKAIKNMDFGLYYWDRHSTPNELLSEALGWDGWAEITEKEYNKLLKYYSRANAL
jgi:hypothetical protein